MKIKSLEFPTNWPQRSRALLWTSKEAWISQVSGREVVASLSLSRSSKFSPWGQKPCCSCSFGFWSLCITINQTEKNAKQERQLGNPKNAPRCFTKPATITADSHPYVAVFEGKTKMMQSLTQSMLGKQKQHKVSSCSKQANHNWLKKWRWQH